MRAEMFVGMYLKGYIERMRPTTNSEKCCYKLQIIVAIKPKDTIIIKKNLCN